ncbi:MAG TPA: RimK/LysX family protein [Pseudolabrys sp.]|nr:RimK/LysX family protein [Pseudolabrys sp.]
MRPLRCFLAVAALWGGSALAQSTPQQPGAAPSTPTVAGWIETVTFPEYGITLDAKLDTGAVSSSVSVTGLERFKRKGKTWYRFTIEGANGKSATIEQQTSRLSRVMRAEVKDVLRPIVRLKVCVAGHEAVTDFNLTDRSSQDYQVLIGRKFLGGRVLVDAGHTYVAAKPCGGGT